MKFVILKIASHTSEYFTKVVYTEYLSKYAVVSELSYGKIDREKVLYDISENNVNHMERPPAVLETDSPPRIKVNALFCVIAFLGSI